MKVMVLLIMVLMLGVEGFCAGMVQYRDFLSHDGKAIRGRVMRYDSRARKVTIERDNKKVFTVPIYAFSDADQQYILQWEFNKVFLSDSSFQIDAKRKKMKIEKGNDYYSYYGYSISNTKTEQYGYEVIIANRSASTLNNLEVEYCIFYEQEKAERSKQITEEGLYYGVFDLNSLNPKSSRSLLTEPVTIFTRELDADWYYYSGADNKQSGKIRGVWVRVSMKLDNGEVLARDFCMPDSLSNSESWSDSSNHVGMNGRSKKRKNK